MAHADLAEVLTLTGGVSDALEHARASLEILEQLSAADPTNAVYRRNIGLCYDKHAQAYARLGKDETHSESERTKDWAEARGWYKKTWELFSTLRDHGGLMPTDSQLPEQFATKMAECDTAIGKVSGLRSSDR